MFIEIDGLNTHVEVEGPTGGEAVLMLHSLGTNLHVWDPQAAALARTHRVLRPDLRGHGLTDAPPGDYTMAQLARDALAVLDALEVRHAHVGGVDASLSPTTTVAGHLIRPATSAARVSRSAAAHPA